MAEKDRERAEKAITVTASAFPIELWRKWEESCQKDFGDCRWIKMWHDHIRSKEADKIEALEKSIAELESKGKEEKKEEEEFVETMGGKVKKGGD